MAFPTIIDRTEYQLTTAGDPSPTFVQRTGDLVVIFLALTTAQDPTAIGSGFIDADAGSVDNIRQLWKVLDGSEGGTCAVTLATNCKAASIAYNIQGFYNGGGNPFIGAAIETGTSAAPNPGLCNPATARDYLWLAAFSHSGIEELDDDTWCNNAPTSFGNLVQKSSGTGGAPSTNCMVAAADRNFNAASLDPDAFGTDQSGYWEAVLWAIRPAEIRIPYINIMPQLLAH